MHRRFDPRAATGQSQPPELPPVPPPAAPADPSVAPDRLLGMEGIEQIIDATYLQNLSEASGGFYFVLIDQEDLPPGVRTQLGFTNRRTGGIYILREAAARLLQQPNGDRKIRGFFAHEAGHHAPTVVKLETKLVETLGKQDMEPHELQEYFVMDEEMQDAMREDISTRQLFWRAVNG